MNDAAEKQIAPMEVQATSMMQVIERAAMNPDVDIDKMERLLQMKERLDAKAAEQAFNVAFSEMQANMPVITENGAIEVNGVVRSKYALFEDINEEVKPILVANHFGIRFRTQSNQDSLTVTAILSHAGGHSEETSLTLPIDMSGSKNSVQGIGSSTEYGKRYTMKAILNITTRGADDDGNGATETITEEQIADLECLIDEVKADKAKFLRYLKAKSLKEIRSTSYDTAVKALEAKRKA